MKTGYATPPASKRAPATIKPSPSPPSIQDIAAIIATLEPGEWDYIMERIVENHRMVKKVCGFRYQLADRSWSQHFQDPLKCAEALVASVTHIKLQKKRKPGRGFCFNQGPKF